VTIRDSLFAGNIITNPAATSPNGGGLYVQKLSSLVVENCDFITNGVPFSIAGNGYNASTYPCNNGFFGTAIYVRGVPATISNCRFLGNFARQGSTVGFSGACGGSSISNCLFAANQHNVVSAGWEKYNFGTINVQMSALADALTISGCTIAYNACGSDGAAAGLTVKTGTVDVRDSIIFGNRVASNSTVGSEITVGESGAVNLAYSLVTGSSDAYCSGSIVAGTGVIYGDPLFVTDDATVLGKLTFNTSKAYYDRQRRHRRRRSASTCTCARRLDTSSTTGRSSRTGRKARRRSTRPTPPRTIRAKATPTAPAGTWATTATRPRPRARALSRRKSNRSRFRSRTAIRSRMSR